MPTRRSFLAGVPVAGIGAALALGTGEAQATGRGAGQECIAAIALEHGWQFMFDREAKFDAAIVDKGAAAWQAVSVPHTWQSLGGEPDYVGVAWYRYEIHAPAEWESGFARVEFEAVYHTAHVYLNGAAVGEHVGKGYTAFCCDLSPRMKYGESNVLLVRVDNSFSNAMLPRMTSFDWANDGGLVRPVRLLITPRVFIERMEIDAVPDLAAKTARVAVRAVVRNTLSGEAAVRIAGRIRRAGAAAVQAVLAEKQARLQKGGTQTVALDDVVIAEPALWHFDAPHLYEAEVTLDAEGERHALTDAFGVRKFEARGKDFYLNGERVALMGVERMAGSHPQLGMAETAEWIEANHRDMKELNCVFTRVHWPQDRRVLDFCDRNGILMQEEVPAWGPFTFADISAELLAKLEANGCEQLQEAIARDRNHPCIVSWGLCNEVDGKNPNSKAFALAMAREARASDPARLLTYASHSLRQHPELDMAGEFDFISANEYFGSWYPGGPRELAEHLASLRRAFPDKPIVISEYGWCECQPQLPPGDANRVKIVDEHTDVMRASGEVAGAIYFDYNDYRTIVGDKGAGALRQRVHGVVDLYAGRKPSFEALRRQSSPVERLTLERDGAGFKLNIATRPALPAYTLRGYQARWLFYGYDDLPMAGKLDNLPELAPGSSYSAAASATPEKTKRIVVDILRPGGFSAGTVEMRLEP